MIKSVIKFAKKIKKDYNLNVIFRFYFVKMSDLMKNLVSATKDGMKTSVKNQSEVIEKTNSDLDVLKNEVKDNKTEKNIEKQEIDWETVVNMKIYTLKETYPTNWLEMIRWGMEYEIKKLRIEKNKTLKESDKLDEIEQDIMLNKIVQDHSKDMAKNKKLNHTNSKWETFSDRLNKAKQKNYWWSENILKMTTADCTIKKVIETRKNSTQWHKENMINYDNKVWFWYAEDDSYNSYFTAVFCLE